MLRQYSKEAEMIVMTLPLPRYKGKLIIWMEDIRSTLTDIKLSFQKGSESSPLCCMVGRDDKVSKSIKLHNTPFLVRDMPPSLLIRGNQETVLTFYS